MPTAISRKQASALDPVSEQMAPTVPKKMRTDDVLRAVGRNLVIFQHVEQALKVLTAQARFQAPASEFVARFATHRGAIEKKSMGELVGKLVGTVLQPDSGDLVPDDPDEAWLGFQFTIESDAEVIARLRDELKELVDRRNELVHHFLPRWQATVAGDAAATLGWLDTQRTAALALLDRLQGWVGVVDAACKEHAAFLASDVGQPQLELVILRSSRLVLMLGHIALATPRTDGWTLLSRAGQIIKRDAPTELEELGTRFGQQNLKGVITGSGLLDVADEPTPRRGTRTIYRINKRWRLEGARSD